jgi:ATP diphosphatase
MELTTHRTDQGHGDATSAATGLVRLVAIMTRLRDSESGCPWDRAQDFGSIAPYTIEEAYEVADAIGRGDMADLKDELGDLLLQVVFHARMAQEAGAFALADVIEAICAKMERRHPHIFGDATADTADAVLANWEAIKATEKPRASVMDDIPIALPALTRAEKLQKRAARTGFDWPDAGGPRAKVAEELAELDAATTQDARADELGDLLFAIVNLARHMGVDPESALRAASAKFDRRFRIIEAAPCFADMTLAEKDELWRAAKRAPLT